MHNNPYKQRSFIRHEIFVNTLEFFNLEEVTLVGQIEVNGRLEFAQYILHKRTLYQLLKNAGSVGEAVIQLIVDRFKQPHDVPVKLDFEVIYGHALCLQNSVLKLDRSYYQNDAGDWKVDYHTNLFFIDSAKPINTDVQLRML